jgi:hypothetical protein
MPWLRCIFESTDNLVEITLDVLVDADRTVDGAVTFFGYFRNKDRSDNHPFALTYDSKLDFGSSAVAIFPVRGRKIVVGMKLPYVEYYNGAQYSRGEIGWQDDLTLKSYRNYDQ